MRVAIFFDGKNFHAGFRDATGTDHVRLDFPLLAGWLVERVGGTSLWGAHYYTGIERGDQALTESQQGLAKFLQMLEVQPGFFVHRFSRKVVRRPCIHCGEVTEFTHEKEVDTTMVADMVRLAAVNGFDILVMVSGDADLAPAVENVRELGKKVFVATWGRGSLAARLRQASFDHIDLTTGLNAFRTPEPGRPLTDRETLVVAAALPVPAEPPETIAAPPVDVGSLADTIHVEDGFSAAQATMLVELAAAERKFANGYVGVNYFLHNWRSNVLDDAPEVRQRILDALIKDGKVEIYEAPDSNKAMRRIS